MVNRRKQYKSGNLVYVYKFPFEPRNIDEPITGECKPRPAIILGQDENHIEVIPVMAVSSKNGATEQPDYHLFPNEVKVPKGIPIKDKDLIGVIKTDRVERFKKNEISAALGEFPLKTKIEVLLNYEENVERPWFKQRLDRYEADHQQVMENFKENIVAEKLNFLKDKNGENQFESLRYTKLDIHTIQQTGKQKNLKFFSLNLTDGQDCYSCSIATTKNTRRMLKEWGTPKAAIDWLKEDAKFHYLVKNINHTLKSDLQPNPDKYKSFADFKRVELRKLKKQELER